jgi:predicted nucleotidyltransferase component of viral defense system
VGAEAYVHGLPVSLEGLPAAHLRVLLDGLPVFERYGLVLAGGYAFRAHEILHRPSQDLDFATRDDTPLPEIAEHVRNAFQSAGYRVGLVEATGRYARLTLRLPGSGEELEMDLLKEALDPSFVTVQVTAVTSVRALSLEDTVGLKARAWHDRFVIRDIIDLHAAASTFSYYRP